MLVVITAASIVASQALISASYQIVAQVRAACIVMLLSRLARSQSAKARNCWLSCHGQAIAQGFFPKFHVTHTSREHSGQIFIAVVNYT